MCNGPEQELINSSTTLDVSRVPVIRQMIPCTQVFQNCTAAMQRTPNVVYVADTFDGVVQRRC